MSVTRFSLLIIVLFGLFFILRIETGVASGSERETDLFNKGYEYLFSFKPEKAAETFRIFLKEFPESSARDAALFWLGKTLISMKLYSEAELTFQMIRTEFPDSPFIAFIDTEMDEIAKIKATGSIKDAREAPQGRDPEKLAGDVNVFKAQVSELQAENARFTDRIEELELQAEQRLRDMRIMNSYLTKLMFQKKEAPQQKPDNKAAEERDRLKATLEEEKKTTAALRNQIADVKKQQALPQTLQDRPSSPQLAPGAVVRIKNRDYLLTQIIDHQTTAALLFRILRAKDPVWRFGDPLNDFIAEELLLQEAARAGIMIDQKKQKELVESHKLSPAEADYLRKFLTIAGYIDSQYMDAASQHWVEVLSGDYKPGDAASKTVLATDIQKAAREGRSYEEIGRLYPNAVQFLRLTPQEFSTQYKDKSQIIEKLNFQKEETVVIWSDNGYMLIKPVTVRVPFDPFLEMKADEKEKIREFAIKHIDALKKRN